MATDRLARQLLNMTSDPNVADPVKLAAIKDALDRGGVSAKTTVSVEVSTKPFELVFDPIIAGPRDNHRSEATDSEIEAGTALAIEGEIDAEIIDSDDGDPSFGLDAVEIQDADVIVLATGESLSRSQQEFAAEYTDAPMNPSPGPIAPDPYDSSSGTLSPPYPGPLGPTGPAGRGLLSLQHAVEAAADMRAREAARIRDMRRR